MKDRAAPRSAVIVAMPGDIDYGRADQVLGQIRAAFAAGAPVVIADFTITTFCDCAVMQRMLAVQRYAAARHAQLRLVVPPAGPVRRILEVTGLEQQFQLYPTACHAAAARLVPLPRNPRRGKPGDSGPGSRR
jgi:anti-anti-sigma factor